MTASESSCRFDGGADDFTLILVALRQCPVTFGDVWSNRLKGCVSCDRRSGEQVVPLAFKFPTPVTKSTQMNSAPVAKLPIPNAAKVFLLTVPKCAGTSVAAFLSTLFEPDDICPGPSAGIWNYRPTEVTWYKLFQGHFDHDFIDGLTTPGIKLTILRDPCSRLVSLYDFWRSYSWDYINNELPPPPTNGPAVAKSSRSCGFSAHNQHVR